MNTARKLGPHTLSNTLAPTKVKCEFLKSIFFVVTVFLWSNRVVIKKNIYICIGIRPESPTWSPGGWGEGRFSFFLSLMFYEKNISI
jgi:hypothetical protein